MTNIEVPKAKPGEDIPAPAQDEGIFTSPSEDQSAKNAAVIEGAPVERNPFEVPSKDQIDKALTGVAAATKKEVAGNRVIKGSKVQCEQLKSKTSAGAERGGAQPGAAAESKTDASGSATTEKIDPVKHEGLRGLMDQVGDGIVSLGSSTLEKLKPILDFFVDLFKKLEGPYNKVREWLATSMGSLSVSLKGILPASVTEGFSVFVGSYGIFHATIKRLGVQIIDETVAAAKDPMGTVQKVGESIAAVVPTADDFHKQYDRAVAWGKTKQAFPDFIRGVAELLKAETGGIAFTMSQLVGAATRVADGVLKIEDKSPAPPATTLPSAPAASPPAAPAIPETTADPSVIATVEVAGNKISIVKQDGEQLIRMGDRNFLMKLPDFGDISLNAEALSKDGSNNILLDGSAIGGIITKKLVVKEAELARARQSVLENPGNVVNLTYIEQGTTDEKKANLRFEEVPKNAAA